MSKRQEEPKEGVPGWVVSFGDMITNLLACFVLLLSLSQRDKALFEAGMKSYKDTISSYGMSNWFSQDQSGPGMDFKKIKYPTEMQRTEEDPSRVLDHEDNKIQKLFTDLTERMSVDTSNTETSLVSVLPITLHFSEDRREFPEKSKAILIKALNELRGIPAGKKRILHILAKAPKGRSGKEGWVASAIRAEKVAGFFREKMKSDPRTGAFKIAPRGVGPSGGGCKKLGVLPEKTNLILVVTKER